MRRLTASAMILLPLCLAAVAAPAVAGTVETGQEAPRIHLTGDDGTAYDSETLKGAKPLVVIFYRGPW